MAHVGILLSECFVKAERPELDMSLAVSAKEQGWGEVIFEE